MSLLSVNFMGLPLKNPIIAAAGPWCRDDRMERLELHRH